MNTRIVFAACGVLLVAACARAQTTATAINDPFPKPINTTDDVVTVNFVQFASLPDVGGQELPASSFQLRARQLAGFNEFFWKLAAGSS